MSGSGSECTPHSSLLECVLEGRSLGWGQEATVPNRGPDVLAFLCSVATVAKFQPPFLAPRTAVWAMLAYLLMHQQYTTSSMYLSLPELTSSVSANKSKNNRNFLDTWGDFHISVHLFLIHILFKYKLHFFFGEDFPESWGWRDD